MPRPAPAPVPATAAPERAAAGATGPSSADPPPGARRCAASPAQPSCVAAPPTSRTTTAAVAPSTNSSPMASGPASVHDRPVDPAGPRRTQIGQLHPVAVTDLEHGLVPRQRGILDVQVGVAASSHDLRTGDQGQLPAGVRAGKGAQDEARCLVGQASGSSSAGRSSPIVDPRLRPPARRGRPGGNGRPSTQTTSGPGVSWPAGTPAPLCSAPTRSAAVAAGWWNLSSTSRSAPPAWRRTTRTEDCSPHAVMVVMSGRVCPGRAGFGKDAPGARIEPAGSPAQVRPAVRPAGESRGETGPDPVPHGHRADHPPRPLPLPDRRLRQLAGGP